MVDTHCHLDMEPFRYHEEEYLKHAKEAGVHTLITLGIDLVSSEKAVSLARTYPNVYAAVGLHPDEAVGADISTVDAFIGLAEREKVVAIGEVGLDYYRLDGDDKRVKREQQLIFDQFCSLAVDLKLPIIVHSRAAIGDALGIVKHYMRDLPVIFHSFDGTHDEAKSILEAGGYIGINNMISYPKNEELRATVAKLPLNKIVLETDAPFLPPQAKRGEKCEPADVAAVAELIAELKRHPVPVVERATDVTVRQIFSKLS